MWDPDPRISILLPNPEQDQNLAGGFNSKMTLAKPKYSNFQAYIIIYFFYLYLKNKKERWKNGSINLYPDSDPNQNESGIRNQFKTVLISQTMPAGAVFLH